MTNFYISYSSKDLTITKTVQDHLLRGGFKPWIDQNPRPGQDWRFDMDDAIRASDAILVVMTPNAAESTYVTYEWSFALGLGKPVIPVVFKRSDMHPRLLSLEIFHVHAWREPEHFWDHFIREMKRTFTESVAPIAQQPAPAQIPVQSQSKTMQQAVFNRSVMPTESGNWLVVRRGPNLNQMFQLKDDIVSLGRESDNQIVIDDKEVSRHHLRLTKQGVGYAIEDLNSTNGTSVNGYSLSYIQTLNPGDAILLGDSIILSYEVIE